jgi:hypothetical protein
MKELPGVVAAAAAALPRWPLPPADNQTREEIEKKKRRDLCGSWVNNCQLFSTLPTRTLGHCSVCAYLIFLLNAFHLLPFPSCDPYLIIEAEPTSRKPGQMPRLPRRKCTHAVAIVIPPPVPSACARQIVGLLSFGYAVIVLFGRGGVDTLIKKRFQV